MVDGSVTHEDEYIQIECYDSENERKFVRVFQSSVDSGLLVWHTDEFDRDVKVLYSSIDNDWQFQFDDESPAVLRTGDEFKINKDVFHRLIKSESCNSNLILEITETR